jgi:2-keto-3-deoxy-L-rhamnonate aldolase RhmA
MGHPGRSDAPEVRAAMDNAFATIVAEGKIPGSAGSAGSIANYLDKGCLYVYTHIPKLLAAGTAEFMAVVQKQDIRAQG